MKDPFFFLPLSKLPNIMMWQLKMPSTQGSIDGELVNVDGNNISSEEADKISSGDLVWVEDCELPSFLKRSI